MVIFNQTFSSDKHIYYPSNWETGKTAIQLHEEWKLTISYSFLSNLFQSLAAIMWILVLAVVVISIKELWRISHLSNNSREKIELAKYLTKSFLASTFALAFGCLYVTLTLLNEEWTRMALFKGVLGWGVLLMLKYLMNNKSKIIKKMADLKTKKTT